MQFDLIKRYERVQRGFRNRAHERETIRLNNRGGDKLRGIGWTKIASSYRRGVREKLARIGRMKASDRV